MVRVRVKFPLEQNFSQIYRLKMQDFLNFLKNKVILITLANYPTRTEFFQVKLHIVIFIVPSFSPSPFPLLCGQIWSKNNANIITV